MALTEAPMRPESRALGQVLLDHHRHHCLRPGGSPPLFHTEAGLLRRFIQKYGKWAVGERCQCGHAKTEHKALVEGQADGVAGCVAAGSACAQFRRLRWIFEEETAG